MHGGVVGVFVLPTCVTSGSGRAGGRGRREWKEGAPEGQAAGPETGAPTELTPGVGMNLAIAPAGLAQEGGREGLRGVLLLPHFLWLRKGEGDAVGRAQW